MHIDKVQIIKDRLTMQDIVRQYGFNPDKAGFMCCPFHAEKTASFKVYKGKGGWHCFGCGESGDEISFVRKLFGLSFPDTLKKIDVDFSLNLYGNHTFEELRQSKRKQQAILAERERKEREKEQADNEYWAVFDEWKRLDDNKRNYAPKTPDEEWHPLFVEALQKLACQEYLLDMAEVVRK
jgi:DNA primase